MMAGFVRHRHLHRQHATRREGGGQPRQQSLMVRQPMQRGIGQDQIDRPVRYPVNDVALSPADVSRTRPSLLQHRGAAVQPLHHGLGVTTFQGHRMLTGTAAQVPDDARIQIIRQTLQQIMRRSIPLGLETTVLSGIPNRGHIDHGRKPPRHALSMVPPLRLELRTSGSTNRRSNQLS
tara:strand:+ start:9407 stop:9940 length:534 start_codon:yes stop_codon:yes gene_type:complete